MKQKLLAMVLLLMGFTCQAQNRMDDQGRRQGHWVKTDKQGIKIYEGNFVDGMETDTFTYYHPNGKVRIRNVYSVPGKICYHQVYDAAGHLLAQGNFNQKNRDGKWEFFHESGKILKITHYKMGVRHGMQILYTSAGDTAEYCNWSDNHRDGHWWKRIGRTGYITATYVKGLIEGRMEEYDQNGKICREGNYLHNDRHGHFKYFEDGVLMVDETWKEGIMKDRMVRLTLPEERFVSIYGINYMAPQGKGKTYVYLTDGSRLIDMESTEDLYRHIGMGRFTMANKESRIMVATDLIVGTTHDREGREVLSLDPKPDFDVFPDEDCMKMLHSLQLQRQTEANGGFDFDQRR